MKKSFNQEEAFSLIRDLVRKFPKGPSGSLTREHYDTEITVYSDIYDNYVIQPVEKAAEVMCQYASRYTPEYLWTAAKHIPHLGTRSMIRQAFSGETLSKRQLTLRKNRIDDKLKRSTAKLRIDGTKGIWGVKWTRYEKISFYVHANNKHDAITEGAVVSGLFGHDMNAHLYVEFVDLGHSKDAQNYNLAISKKQIIEAEDRLRRAHENIKILEAKLEKVQEEAKIVSMAHKL